MTAYTVALCGVVPILYFLIVAGLIGNPFKLCHLPGPVYCRFSRAAFLLHMFKGDNGAWVHKLHVHYNSRAIVVGPNLISIYGPNASRVVYGTLPHNVLHKDPEIADVFCLLGGNSGRNLPSINDSKTAMARRRSYGPLFSSTNLHIHRFQRIGSFMEHFRLVIHKKSISASVAVSESTTFDTDIMQPLRSSALYSIASIVFNPAFVEKYFQSDDLDVTIPDAVDFFFGDGLLEMVLGPVHHLISKSSFFRNRILGLGSARRLRAIIDDKLAQAFVVPEQFGRVTADRARSLSNNKLVEELASGPPSLLRTALESGLDIGTVKSEVITFIVAGGDTVVLSTCFIAWLLSINPTAQEKLHAELASVFHDEDERHRQLDIRALENCDYLTWVIKEGLRLYPAIPGPIPRTTVSSESDGSHIHIEGFIIPPYTSVLIPPGTSNRDSEVFADPDSFIPERWSKENETPDMKASMLSFAAGPRVCIGQHLAWMQMRYNIAWLFLDYFIKPAKENRMHETTEWLSLHPVDGKCLLTITSRSVSS